ncbi:PTS transporter subunit EIIB [Mycoplasma sp. 'Moose RK']|uniref:PTS transporter subunit EIIB n=1 Tax=Mycoplasma sp. 'Moose RK' TaxID=2780095 RepID=UPI0018C2FBA7|nr:PTS transporter subunit EIIB [Mycoplasma sp. 'Moose RK']MBG0731065.1 PTS transporter subunit EIIB [Mycoplasma sp. 'Moose RK']
MIFFSKVVYLFLQIITFGFFGKLISKKLNKTRSDFQYSVKLDFEIEKLINLLGGKKNIENSSYKISRLIIKLRTTENLDFEKIKQLKGVSGVVVDFQTVNLIVGSRSKVICEAIENFSPKKTKNYEDLV